MATSFQTYIDRENIGNSVVKNARSMSASVQGHKVHTAKKGLAPTPRKALGDLGNIQQAGPTNVFQTPKPSKVRIFNETPRTKTSVKSKKGPSSTIASQKNYNKIASESQTQLKRENNLPKRERIIPFVDREDDLPRAEFLTKLLTQINILNPLPLISESTAENEVPRIRHHVDNHVDHHVDEMLFDDTMANVIGYDETPQLIEIKSLPEFDDPPPFYEYDLS